MNPRTTLGTTLAALAVGALALTGVAPRPAAATHPADRDRPHPADSLSVLTGEPTPTPALPGMPTRSNVLMITADDLSTLDLPYMPHVRRLIAEQGVTFSDAIAPTPICAPARASLLSGQYAHNDGTVTISGPHGGYQSFDESRTVAMALQAAGYDTLFAGKFINGYGEHGTARQVPPGWTDWRATIDPTTYHFFNPTLNVNGALRPTHGYSTGIISHQADQMIGAPARRHRPWFAWVNYVAPHFGGPIEPGDPKQVFRGTAGAISTTVPAPRDRGRFAGVPLPNRPDLFEPHRYTKVLPKNSPARAHIPPVERVALRMAYDQRLEADQGVDRAVAAQLRTLRRTGQLDRTVIVFASDNGYATGEHNRNGKLWHYDEIVRIPMMMRGPGVPSGRTVATPITNPDVAATILGFAGARPQRTLDGVDMRPWLSAPTQQRVVPIEGWPVTNGTHRLYDGVTVGPWTYIRLRHHHEELYDRTGDPYQLHDLVHVASAQRALTQLRSLTKRYRNCSGSTCPRQFYALG